MLWNKQKLLKKEIKDQKLHNLNKKVNPKDQELN